MPDDSANPTGFLLTLEQFLKLVGIANTGGEAKWMIQGSQVQVNGQLELRRRRKLQKNDVVEAGDHRWRVGDSIDASGE